MDGMLSQDEINALLNGIGTDDTPGDDTGADSTETASLDSGEELLTAEEKDAIGEVANISMGTSATTLYSLVNRKVSITTPVVTTATWDKVIEDYEKPCVFIRIKYKAGLDGTNILVLKEADVKVITDLMMGGDGTNTDGELGELHLSAISEAMNQMMGSSATSLSSMLGKVIDISPPEASLVDLNEFDDGGQLSDFLSGTFVKITFSMQIEDLVDSKIIQLYPVDFAKSLYDHFINNKGATQAAKEPEPIPIPAPPLMQAMPQPTPMAQQPMGMPMQQPMGMGTPMQQPMGMGMPMQQSMGMGMPMQQQQPMGMPNINIQPAQFQSFSGDIGAMQSQENIGLIRDVPLEVTVELGRTNKSISDILDFSPGTIIELDKIAGEPIDVLVNGKFVAKGEVVVIEENFGVRVTEIVK
ncbi:MAG TPA: flagellar motor switch phosphatase FliY [Lachnospiraceae bacterium]|nr:flagellar motor switch phosphatase FliY [Lachnospiraceae bacterium]